MVPPPFPTFCYRNSYSHSSSYYLWLLPICNLLFHLQILFALSVKVMMRGVTMFERFLPLVASRSKRFASASASLVEDAMESSVLTDLFGRKHTYLRLSLTERCNLRCQYCMPEEGVSLTPDDNLLTKNDYVNLTKVFAKNGVTKIRLTGGEPLLYPQLTELVSEISAIPTIESIGLTTNGLVLSRKLKALKDAGLTKINISLDTFHEFKFNLISRRKGLKKVLQSIDDAIEIGFTPKVNVVLTKGMNDDELLDFVEYTKDRDVDVRFIEFMPFDGNRWNMEKFISYRDMLDMIKTKYDITKLDDEENSTSKAYRVLGYKGKLGFITSMSENFCSSCNRLRITADGNLKVCLFGPTEVNLKESLRDNVSVEELEGVIEASVKNKKKQHAGMLNIAKQNNRPMTTIGG
eukprot:m.6201 g.6201  ORF g.6201 m.6201 type:complete len:407 (-) comp2558_c0_seq1:124-1344(-)